MILTMITVAGGVRHILQYGAAEDYVKHLHSFADTQDGEMVAQAEIRRLELQDVQLCVDAAGSRIAFSKKSGRDISPARQDQSVAPRQSAGT